MVIFKKKSMISNLQGLIQRVGRKGYGRPIWGKGALDFGLESRFVKETPSPTFVHQCSKSLYGNTCFL